MNLRFILYEYFIHLSRGNFINVGNFNIEINHQATKNTESQRFFAMTVVILVVKFTKLRPLVNYLTTGYITLYIFDSLPRKCC
jgi:hypothetical protein